MGILWRNGLAHETNCVHFILVCNAKNTRTHVINFYKISLIALAVIKPFLLHIFLQSFLTFIID